MAQATDTITVNDGTATPVAITFKTVKASPVLTVWKDKRKVKPAYWPEITLSADLPATTAKLRKAEVRVAVPVVDSVTGLALEVGRIRVIADLPMSMLQADVNDLYAFAMNALANVLVKGAVRDLDPIIG